MNPSLVKRLVYPLHERLLSRSTFAYLRDLEHSQWLARAELEALQLKKLTGLLAAAWEHSPWHAERIRAAGLEVRAGGPPVRFDDLRRLPLMAKADCVANRDRMVWQSVPGGAFRYTTGGSSGEPLVFYFGRQRQASDAAGRMRARRWWGVDVGDREVYLWGAPVELAKTDRVKTFRDRLFNQLVLNAFDMSPQRIDAYIAELSAFRPRCVYGYASSIALLAARARDRGVDMRSRYLKVVCTTGEPLYPQQRELIESVFGVPAANEFGSRDIGFTAHQSPDGQMLLMSESIILEILDPDGNPVCPGEVGEAVMTGLCSNAQPFIRYRTGDMVRMTEEPCRSGRGLHVLGEVMGRTTDFVVAADGTVMHALAVIYVLRELDGVAEFKFIQHTPREVEVRVVPAAAWDGGTQQRIVTGLRARLGSEVNVDVRLVDAIAPEASGKYRYVVSHVALPDGLGGVLGEAGQAAGKS
ncbi:MAG TPA: phenylacetate--CoA ligase family protein [Gammaproteobacteria bacterium]|nr:phenylacetate--CoA ligase family protein [Gammaproteobacteria bacterium]